MHQEISHQETTFCPASSCFRLIWARDCSWIMSQHICIKFIFLSLKSLGSCHMYNYVLHSGFVQSNCAVFPLTVNTHCHWPKELLPREGSIVDCNSGEVILLLWFSHDFVWLTMVVALPNVPGEMYLLESSSFFVRFLELALRFRFARLIKDERVSLGLQPGSGADAALERPGTFSKRSWQPMSLTSNVPEMQSTFIFKDNIYRSSCSESSLFNILCMNLKYIYIFRSNL